MRTEEHLAFYARRFRAVELNTTYYGIPASSVLARMRNAAPPPFQFAVKAYRGITHTGGVDETLCRQFQDAMEPLRESGQLAIVLFQFPHAFAPDRDGLDKLARLRERFPDDSLAVEFRRRDWLARPNLEHVRALNLAWCCVDEPALPGLLPPVAISTTADGYVRYHGRNRAAWYGGDGQERYNYLYRERELLTWAANLTQLAAVTRRLFIFFNNCYMGHAVKNAMLLAEILARLELVPNQSKESTLR